MRGQSTSANGTPLLFGSRKASRIKELSRQIDFSRLELFDEDPSVGEDVILKLSPILFSKWSELYQRENEIEYMKDLYEKGTQGVVMRVVALESEGNNVRFWLSGNQTQKSLYVDLSNNLLYYCPFKVPYV